MYILSDDCVVSGGVEVNGWFQKINGTGSAQFANDKNGKLAGQITTGTGVVIGSGANVCGTIAIYPGLKDVSAVEGFSTNIGFSYGNGTTVGGDIIGVIENGKFKPIGFSFSFGIGAGVEGHFLETYTVSDKPNNKQKCPMSDGN